MTYLAGLKPFDLEAAKRGDPIMYANGEPVAEFHVWKDGSISSRPMRGIEYLHEPDGTCYGNSPRHLVMAPPPMREVTYWANILAKPLECGVAGRLYTTEHIAKSVAKSHIGMDFSYSSVAQPITLKVPV